MPRRISQRKKEKMKRKDKTDLADEVINYDRLDKIIKAVEELVITKNELDFVEQKLLYDILLDRRMDKIHQIKMSDSVGNMPIMDLVKKAFKKDKDKDNDVGI